MKKIIIGGGAAGLMAAYASALKGNETVLIEKNEKLGKKIYITGKGRCNLTNYCIKEEFLRNVVSNSKFLYGALSRLDPYSTVELFNSLGLKTKVERGNRVFPESDTASDVTKSLERALKRLGVKILLNCKVQDILVKDGTFDAVLTEKGETINGDVCIVATGGLSYPSTGSTGDGYAWAKGLGHTIVSTIPSLVGLKTEETFVRDLEGLSLRNIVLKVYIDGKQKSSEMGELLFTHNGVSGPLILTASAKFAKVIDEGKDVRLLIDLKPALSFEVLDQGMIRDFAEESNRTLKNVLVKRIPSSMVPVVLSVCGLDGDKKVNSVTAAERKSIVHLLKGFELRVKDSGGFQEAVVTQGGINIKEINPKTMESLIVKKLYFAGEIMDVDAFTGGFNLQIAWSTGYTAGLA